MTKKVAMSCGLAVLVATLWVGLGCIPVVGGPCEYDVVTGTATIMSVTSADASAANCADDPVVVVFDFMPDGGDSGDLVPGLTLTIGGGMNPPQAWVQQQGLTVGSAHDCEQQTIVSGTCTPVIYELTDIDYAAGIAACH